jgi:hypothetical protein
VYVFSRIIITALLIGAGAAVEAQTTVTVQLPADARHQAQVFEDSLRSAIVTAGRNLLTRAREVVPDIMLRFEQEPAIFSTWMPKGDGLVVFVEVPGIEATTAQLWQAYRQLGMRNIGGGATPARPAPPAPPDPVVAPMTSPEQEYSEFTRQALMSAMLDNAFALPLKDGQTLTIVVGVINDGSSMSLTNVEKRLYLSIKSEDLVALKQGRITRDEAKSRIAESRY